VTIATTIPPIVRPDIDLDVVDCELAELELEEILPVVLVEAAAVVSAGDLEVAVPAEVENKLKVENELKVEVDDGACNNTDCNISSGTGPPTVFSQRSNDSHSEQCSSPELLNHPN